jgi:predicted Zn-dependent protease
VSKRGESWIINFGGDQQGNYLYVFQVRDPEFIAQISGKKSIRNPLESKERFPTLARLPVQVRVVSAIILIAILFQGYRFLATKLYTVVPLKYDVAIGDRYFRSIKEKETVCTDADLQKLVDDMVSSLALPEDRFSYKAVVVRKADLNAFALPGGRIVIMSGLLEKSTTPEDVLGVLAHEIAHVEQRHGMKNISRSIGTLLAVKLLIGAGFEQVEFAETISEITAALAILSYSRDLEREADEKGTFRLHKNNFSHLGLIRFLKNVLLEEKRVIEKKGQSTPHEWFSTHPATDARIKALRKVAVPEKATQQVELSIPWKDLKYRCMTSSP